MAYEYEKENKEAVMINQSKANKELEEVYFKAEILNRIIGIVKSGRSLGRSLGSYTDSEIILRAIEHELKYTEDE